MNTVYEKIAEVCEKGLFAKDLKSKVVTAYQNKKNKKDIFYTFSEAFDKKLNLAEYEKIEIEKSRKSEAMELIFGSSDFEITTEMSRNLAIFGAITKELTKGIKKETEEPKPEVNDVNNAKPEEKKPKKLKV